MYQELSFMLPEQTEAHWSCSEAVRGEVRLQRMDVELLQPPPEKAVGISVGKPEPGTGTAYPPSAHAGLSSSFSWALGMQHHCQ